MIGWEDVYKVMAAMAPLYVALTLGYASVRWWQMFKPEHCDVINRFNCYFVMPFFSFDFVSNVDPYAMNSKFIAADAISKCVVGFVLFFWANFYPKGSFSSSITAFSMSSLSNTLVVGVPLLRAMYGEVGADLVVQSSVIQFLLWFIILLFLLEIRKARSSNIHGSSSQDSDSLEENCSAECQETITSDGSSSKQPSFWSIMKVVWLKLVKNPNAYACVFGITWALIANRWDLKMPSIIRGSVQIMSKAGGGLSMFTMGLFMAVHGKMIACGARKTIIGMILRFVVGPGTMAVGAYAIRLKGNILRVSILQAALPQSITAFVYAQEYGLHADILRTAVIFGTIASVPLLISYFALLDVIF